MWSEHVSISVSKGKGKGLREYGSVASDREPEAKAPAPELAPGEFVTLQWPEWRGSDVGWEFPEREAPHSDFQNKQWEKPTRHEGAWKDWKPSPRKRQETEPVRDVPMPDLDPRMPEPRRLAPPPVPPNVAQPVQTHVTQDWPTPPLYQPQAMLTLANLKRNEAWPVLRTSALQMWERHLRGIAKIREAELEVVLFVALIVEKQRYHHYSKMLEVSHTIKAWHRNLRDEGRKLAKLPGSFHNLLTDLDDGKAMAWILNQFGFDVEPHVLRGMPALRRVTVERLNDIDLLQQAFAKVGCSTNIYQVQTVRATRPVERPDEWLVVNFYERVLQDMPNCTNVLMLHIVPFTNNQFIF
mgnify:CR=1 FL=1